MAEAQIFGEDELKKRPLWRAMARGWRGKCPSCGQASLFSGFVGTVDTCSHCGEHIAHHRADDLPPYLNIFVVGHVVVGAMLLVMQFTDWNPWLHLALWGAVTIVMAIMLMRPLKGAVIGLQWANRMHGFGPENDFDRDPTVVNLSHHD
ncbi:MAG: DUF983 domain-containing protein [Pseudomonadota bacterium]